MDTWQWHHGFSGGGLLMGLVWLLVAVVVAVIVYRLLRDGGSRGATGEATAKDILQARYARGEIERREYLEKLQDLGR
jgi:putative membrane protein